MIESNVIYRTTFEPPSGNTPNQQIDPIILQIMGIVVPEIDRRLYNYKIHTEAQDKIRTYYESRRKQNPEHPGSTFFDLSPNDYAKLSKGFAHLEDIAFTPSLEVKFQSLSSGIHLLREKYRHILGIGKNWETIQQEGITSIYVRFLLPEQR